MMRLALTASSAAPSGAPTVHFNSREREIDNTSPMAASTRGDGEQQEQDVSGGSDHCTNDYTKVPGMLDNSFRALGGDFQLRPTIITPAASGWIKKSQKTLLAEPVSSSVDSDKQTEERKQAFELLDALTKSGGICVDDCSLHVIIASTHCFDQSLLDTVIKGNENPIERLEQSLLVMAAVIHDRFNVV